MTSAPPDLNQGLSALRRGYDALWAATAPRLVANDVTPEPVPEPGAGRWGLSAVLRFEGNLRATLARRARRVGALAGPGQHVYDEASLHTTVWMLDRYRPHLQVSVVERLTREIDQVVRDRPPIEIDYVGLTAGPSAVLAQGFPRDDTFWRVCEAVARRIGVRREPVEPGPRFAHATLVVFLDPRINGGAVHDHIAASRDVHLGRLCCRELSIVQFTWSDQRRPTTVVRSVVSW